MMASSVDYNTTTTACAQCGKEGGNLNTCNKCKMVKYCNAACKKKHRSKHKKACERRVAELHDEALFKEHPPREECPICLQPLPFDEGQTIFKSCCGKQICNGCIYEMHKEARGRGKIPLCAFCREPTPTSDAEGAKRMKKLTEANNAHAFLFLAGYYARGVMGMPQDFQKANELYLKAGELGCADAYFCLGNSYCDGVGVEVDKKKAKQYWELAAMNGSLDARHNLGSTEVDAGKIDRGFKHLMLAARAGSRPSLDTVNQGFKKGMVTKDEYANILRAYQSRHDEMKSDDRDRAAELG